KMGQTATQVNQLGANVTEVPNNYHKIDSNISFKGDLTTTELADGLNNTKKHLYVLKLEEGKYYVGITNDINKRYNQHLSDIGSEWTKKYKVIGLEYTKELTHVLDEDMEVKKLMMIYGHENVRGGTYSKIILY